MRRLSFKWIFLVTITLLFSSVLFSCGIQAQNAAFDITKFGARPDDTTDSSAAFMSAWKKACSAQGRNAIVIPSGKFMLGPVTLEGPCKGTVEIQNGGVLSAPKDPSLGYDSWITIKRVHNLEISGGGEFFGQGHIAWPYNDCSTNSKCKSLPIMLRLNHMNNVHVEHVKFVNSKNGHMNVFACNNVTINNVIILAHGSSPNTDGIRLSHSTGVRIRNSIIGTGDDCVAMLAGCSNIDITNVHCGPGHGISIGSLGKSAKSEGVTGVTVKNCNFTNTQNGLRIKTWSPSDAILVSDITFQDIYMSMASNPVVIDQNYCPHNRCGQKGISSVEIRNVTISHVWGTSATQVALKFDCSKLKPCHVELRDISLEYRVKGGQVTAMCSNARGLAYGFQRPRSCLQRL